MSSDDNMIIPNFVKIDILIQKLKGGGGIQTVHSNLISLSPPP
jgi:hypothetical protein